MSQIKFVLEGEFSITDLGEPKRFLGLEIVRDRRNKTIGLLQTSHIDLMLRKFDPDPDKTVSTPMLEYRDSEGRNNEQTGDTRSIPYRQAIGSLLYLQGGVRPDIIICY